MKRFTQTLLILFISTLLLAGLSFSALADEERAEKDTDCSSLETHTREDGENVCDKREMKDKECSDRKKISEMSDAELKQFLEDYALSGIEDPEYKDGMFWSLKNFLHEFDSNGVTAIPLNCTQYHVWGELIDAGIEKYYGGTIEKRSIPGSLI